MTAQIVNEAGAQTVPELIDVHLLNWTSEEICLAGFERDELTRRDTVQTWRISGGHQLDQFCCQLVRDSGRPKPRWVQSQGQWSTGRLSVIEEYVDEQRRCMPVARFRALRQDVELLPPLVNAKLIHLRNHRLVLSGIDLHDRSGAEVAQTWLLIREGQEPGGQSHG